MAGTTAFSLCAVSPSSQLQLDRGADRQRICGESSRSSSVRNLSQNVENLILRSKREFSLGSTACFFGGPARFTFQAQSAIASQLRVQLPSPTSQATDAATLDRDAAALIEHLTKREDLRNIAIIAHVDHGKTTLVDAMLRQANVWRQNQAVQERVMDNNALERERGITILAKNTSITVGDIKINILDTPGHADFGGEVERVLNMVDGVLLLVDAVEGPMPQTRFVLRKSLELGLKAVLVVNKVDRPASRPDEVVDMSFDLFCELGASDEQADFETVFCIGLSGKSGKDWNALEDNLQPLFDSIRRLPPPTVVRNGPLQMMVTSLDYDEHKGRIAIGRIRSGVLRKGQDIVIAMPDTTPRKARISDMFVFENFGKVPVTEASAGDIVAVTGLDDVSIGETVCDKDNVNPLVPLKVQEPTVRMEFCVNTSPFAGREGKYVTSRNLRDRLYKELEKNVSLRVEDTDSADKFLVSGRGPLHLGILIETMRREGFEFAVTAPNVILKEIDGHMYEPWEDAHVEVPSEYTGTVVDFLSRRKGQMVNMHTSDNDSITYLHYIMPTRGLLGLRNALLTATRGTVIFNSQFRTYEPIAGDLERRETGSLVSMEAGTTTPFALARCQERGSLFIDPGTDVYEGMVIGIHSRPGDLPLNACREKQLTNMRSAGKDNTVVLIPPVRMSLDDSIEYISADEIVEITPKSVRIAKKDRAGSLRQKSSK
eukprot:CAMPEP_0196651960 /NCGR_PEP_ID=MMETSP1086-20130531/1143_1 /TAXON_ID=77921 /ORGANISM="Cyanoptyche  gloeocystis , Strain SAG4.97" /LENGTH=714 /DNA_ID=CAMNT_0041982267 /DNA_START=133 /DNA_END=2277 /DNA_ORIENTATION=-